MGRTAGKDAGKGMFRSFLSWLGLEPRIKHVGLRPHRTLEIFLPYDRAFDQTVEGIERELGGTVRDSNRARGTIEASFGLTFSERLACTLERIDEYHTRVTIEARHPAQATPAKFSPYVEALARYLS